jgi:hypothetical protein
VLQAVGQVGTDSEILVFRALPGGRWLNAYSWLEDSACCFCASTVDSLLDVWLLLCIQKSFICQKWLNFREK